MWINIIIYYFFYYRVLLLVMSINGVNAALLFVIKALSVQGVMFYKD